MSDIFAYLAYYVVIYGTQTSKEASTTAIYIKHKQKDS